MQPSYEQILCNYLSSITIFSLHSIRYCIFLLKHLRWMASEKGYGFMAWNILFHMSKSVSFWHFYVSKSVKIWRERYMNSFWNGKVRSIASLHEGHRLFLLLWAGGWISEKKKSVLSITSITFSVSWRFKYLIIRLLSLLLSVMGW